MDLDSKSKKGLLDYPMNKENPFMSNLLIPSRKGTISIARANDKGIIDTVTGEVEDTLFIAMKKDLDKEEFVKIFHSQLRMIFDLSKSALKVLSYFMSVTSYSDELDFDLDDCLTFTGYNSKQTIFNSVAELLEKEIIARGKNPYKYYANPKVFYKGDRMLLMSDYRLKKKKDIGIAANQIQLFEDKSKGH